MAEWLERLPGELGVVSSSPDYTFSLSKFIFFISLSFYLSFYFLVLFICLNIEVKQCANIYRKYDNTGSVMEQRSCRFIFAHTPHVIKAK